MRRSPGLIVFGGVEPRLERLINPAGVAINRMEGIVATNAASRRHS